MAKVRGVRLLSRSEAAFRNREALQRVRDREFEELEKTYIFERRQRIDRGDFPHLTEEDYCGMTGCDGEQHE